MQEKNKLLSKELKLWVKKLHNSLDEEKAILYDVLNILDRDNLIIERKKSTILDNKKEKIAYDVYLKTNEKKVLRAVFITVNEEVKRSEFKYYVTNDTLRISTINYDNDTTVIKLQTEASNSLNDLLMNASYDFFDCLDTFRYKKTMYFEGLRMVAKEDKEFDRLVLKTFWSNGYYLRKNLDYGKEIKGNDTMSNKQFEKRYKEVLKRVRIKKKVEE